MNTTFINKIARLIISYLSGNIKNEDNAYLQNWINESKANKALFEKVTSKHYLKGLRSEKSALEKDISSEWFRLNQRINSRRKIRTLVYRIAASAAAILLLFISGWYLVFQYEDDKDRIAFTEPLIKPGSSKAILRMADGSETILASDSVIKMIEHNQIIVNKNDTLRLNDSLIDKMNKYNTIIVPKGGEYIAKLDDGSKIYINSDSRIKIPLRFEKNARKIIFDQGEIYCEIAKNQKRPFIIERNDLFLKVLGTEFNLRYYPNEEEIITTLVEGSVEVGNNLKTELLNPGMQAKINEHTGNIVTQKVEVYKYIAWKNGRMVFENQNLNHIMGELSRWYDVDIYYHNVDVSGLRFTIDIMKYDNLNDVLYLFKKTDKVGFKIEDHKITVTKSDK